MFILSFSILNYARVDQQALMIIPKRLCSAHSHTQLSLYPRFSATSAGRASGRTMDALRTVAAAAILGYDIENGYLNAPVFGRFYLPLAGKRPNKRDTDTPMIVSSASTQDAYKVCHAMAIQQYRLTL